MLIAFSDESRDNSRLLPSFEPFRTNGALATALLFTIVVDPKAKPAPEARLLRSFDTGNGDIEVYTLPDDGYEFHIYNISGEPCCLLLANDRFRQCRCRLRGSLHQRMFGLNNALMLSFAFAGSFHDAALIHASCVAHVSPGDNTLWGYPFIAQSGTGKSTHTGLWMNYIEHCELLNDDNPVVRIVDDEPYIYGSPWSGKTPCYRNLRARLGAVTRIERAPENSIERLSPVEAFASMLPACSSMMWDALIHDNLCNIITRIIETTPQYTLHCRPDEEAARLCHKTIVR